MVHPQHVPCLSSNPICQNRSTWTELPATTTQHNWRRTRIQGWSHHWLSKSQETKETPIQNPLERLLCGTWLLGTGSLGPCSKTNQKIPNGNPKTKIRECYNTTQTNNLKTTLDTNDAITEAEADKQRTPTIPKLRLNHPARDKGTKSTKGISINSYTMFSLIEQAFNNIISLAKIPEGETNHLKQTTIDIEEGMTQVKSSSSSLLTGLISNYKVSPEVLALQALVQNPTALTMAAAFYEYRCNWEENHLPPTSPMNSCTTSPTTTDNLHLGYPYREYTNLDTDLPNQHYK